MFVLLIMVLNSACLHVQLPVYVMVGIGGLQVGKGKGYWCCSVCQILAITITREPSHSCAQHDVAHNVIFVPVHISLDVWCHHHCRIKAVFRNYVFEENSWCKCEL